MTEPLRLDERLVPWEEALTLAALLQREGVPPQAVATAVNGEFVPRGQRAHRTLQPGDTVLTFQAIAGG